MFTSVSVRSGRSGRSIQRPYWWFLTVLVIFGNAYAGDSDGSRTIGYVEKVEIDRLDITMKAKMDTGAATSSIHADIIDVDENEDEETETILFSIVTDEGETRQIKKPVARWVRIKKKDGGMQRRPVVVMDLCIAGRLVEEEINLADRDHFIYDLLIGRNMLEAGRFLVDVSKTFTRKPRCGEK